MDLRDSDSASTPTPPPGAPVSHTDAAAQQRPSVSKRSYGINGPSNQRAWTWLNLLGIVGLATVFIGTAMAFLYAPTDRVQGHAYRIVYVHAPVAWLAYLSVFIVFLGSVGYLWKRSMLADRFARAAAELGLLFISLALITGSLWGRPIWNAWWSWDARLTTTLMLWFIFLGYFTLREYAGDGDRERGARYAAVLGIVAMVDVPIIHQSVKWWRTLHPEPVVLDTSGPNLGNDMLVTLLVCFIGLTVLFAYFLLLKVQVETVRDQLLDRELDRTFGTGTSFNASPSTQPDAAMAPPTLVQTEARGSLTNRMTTLADDADRDRDHDRRIPTHG